MTRTPFNPDDPRWTAYVLGELPEADRTEIEALLSASPEARSEIEALRATAGALHEALAEEAAGTGGIGAEREADLVAASAMPRPARRSPWWLAAAGIAGILIAVASMRDEPGTVPADKRAAIEEDALVEATDPTERLERVENTVAALSGPPSPVTSPAPAEGAPADGRFRSRAGPGGTPPAAPPTTVRFAQPSAATTATGGPGHETRVGLQPAARAAVVFDRSYPGIELNLNPSGVGAGIGGFLPEPPEDRPGGTVATGVAANGVSEALLAFSTAVETGEKELGDKVLHIAHTLRLTGATHNTEAYDPITENDFLSPTTAPLSTFSLDVDTASYANIRRFLGSSQLPPRHAVRIEEMVNYFRYDDPAPAAGSEHPVEITTEVARCFWNLNHKLVRIGVKARDVAFEDRKASNFVFLVDVSGSMDSPDKLPLLKKSFRLLVDTLGENDRVAIVVYASATGLVLPSTTGNGKETILDALENLAAGGSTNGAGGIQLAYETAVSHFIRGGNNRVILATDGDFNVGITDRGALLDLIQEKARSGVFLSVLGFGQGNLKDATMEQLADKGNGNYSYIDSLEEAEKVLVREMGGTLITVAKDVKIQAEFNPARVAAYRLIGYENRALADRDFNDDSKDAGDLGAGHSVCALYEIVPASRPVSPGVDPLRYQTGRGLTDDALSSELLTVKLRYKQPDGSRSVLLTASLQDREQGFDAATADLRWSSAVAAFGLLLRNSAYKGTASFPAVLEVCADALGADPHGDRSGFVTLVAKAAQLLSQ